jgi:hypothetical protein
LIIMIMRRLDEGEVDTQRAALENRRHGYACSATPDDENLMVY